MYSLALLGGTVALSEPTCVPIEAASAHKSRTSNERVGGVPIAAQSAVIVALWLVAALSARLSSAT